MAGTPREVIFSLIFKPKAEAEAGLTPIGFLPYVYRVWMAIREVQQKDGPWKYMMGSMQGQPRWRRAQEQI